ncbi:peroxiredoxin [Paracoccus versutus]|uniref:Glutathione-dependent peroxiredoxin n=2 Tax=Paracoccaceae TaxID=31989 RepID=A0AAQ0KJC2_PARVE|nr:peroxiredoxin [Paracoccus versutus]SFY44179.1 Peroxiredoxin [Paracoccus pantotrophus]
MKGRMMKQGDLLPEVTFQTRVRDESVGGDNPYRWQAMTTADYFKGKRVVLFSLPGAFTPTCSTYQLPGFEKAADEMADLGIDAIYCMSVNDSFVMNQWAKAQNLKNVKVIPDGSGAFTEKVGMLVRKDNLGFGARSWRYAAIVEDGRVQAWFEEPGRMDDCPEDPYGATAPEAVLDWLRANPAKAAA